MAEITFITGGQRSGKSRYAQQLAEAWSATPVYLATARHWDEEMTQRIRRHQADRGERWRNLEEEKFIGSLSFNGDTVLLDCVTLWLNNLFFDNGFDVELSLRQAKEEFAKLVMGDFRLIVVSNELGMGVIPDNEASRKFGDLQGWMNQHIAAMANGVWLMVSGIPVKIK
jgi:adenosylcobinamide kinase/adenosylcobinamide-phosphate guanylyltransferase